MTEIIALSKVYDVSITCLPNDLPNTNTIIGPFEDADYAKAAKKHYNEQGHHARIITTDVVFYDDGSLSQLMKVEHLAPKSPLMFPKIAQNENKDLPNQESVRKITKRKVYKLYVETPLMVGGKLYVTSFGPYDDVEYTNALKQSYEKKGCRCQILHVDALVHDNKTFQQIKPERRRIISLDMAIFNKMEHI